MILHTRTESLRAAVVRSALDFCRERLSYRLTSLL